MVILQVMKITGQPPLFHYAEGVAHQKKSFVLIASHAEGVVQVETGIQLQTFNINKGWFENPEAIFPILCNLLKLLTLYGLNPAIIARITASLRS